MSPGATLIVIPARRASTRLLDKLLLCETGKAVLAHTIERAQAAAAVAGACTPVCVVCDDLALAEIAEDCGVQSIMTEHCDSGTERIARALPSLPPCGAIVNVQADEPEMPAAWIVAALQACQEPEVDVATVAVPIAAGDAALDDPNAVKVVVDHASRALYFSRAPIPAVRQGGRAPSPRALRHVGLYAYRVAFLKRYFELPPSELEQSECLEQLRFLQAGARIRVLVQTEPTHVRGIDTADDYREFVRKQLAASR